ncbi:grasp-with-spasm system SPASM domain peptide maturase [Pedobacter alluvionis]|uniref:Grasp-with-spasm system SPASM domain peptide maturase n=1 Tax=Pedobacter alluvionis TaxID=475253 RepID=A0A497YAH7_9SPHI|nr:grasp-with-spasm system SPASM domain peptide maturase [Pedobacter alluvionis]RLJ80215.1 SPASM domain peptide maturase of grasp-with-spasm system [Pedobacter alluvionis]TFB31497.1 grasp-with-spasm system SPASM domain peptide maturase [Pedobacter alluvionis]
MDKNDHYISLFACCLIVKGASRATIVDIQRGSYIFIPLEIASLLSSENKSSINDLLIPYSTEDQSEIIIFFQHLIDQEYAFYTMEPELFPEISKEFKVHNLITNAILDFDADSDYEVANVILQLENMGCQTIEIRCFQILPISIISNLIFLIQNGLGVVRNVQLLICYDRTVQESKYADLLNKVSRLTSITIHSSPINESHPFQEETKRINYIKQKVSNETHCGYISPGYFTINKSTFLESQSYNSCLNRKISIDVKGNIKNCPALKQSFGHFKQVNLSDVLQDDRFINKWSIKKDDIRTCKDCEFRYICTDCRAFQEDDGDEFFKPLKCSYDPYSMTWSEDFFNK